MHLDPITPTLCALVAVVLAAMGYQAEMIGEYAFQLTMVTIALTRGATSQS